MTEAGGALAVALLGAFHGINPAMGWLFAVARGLQEKDRREVVLSIFPIGVGHELSIAAVVALTAGLGPVAGPVALRVGGGVALLALGLYKFFKPRSHPRWVGMRLSLWELGLWSFIMASAHGAGLMLFPVLLGSAIAGEGHTGPHGLVETMGFSGAALAGRGMVLATLHVLVMLVVMTGAALVVYEKVGLGVLRRAWVNLDLVWSAALVSAGLFTLFT